MSSLALLTCRRDVGQYVALIRRPKLHKRGRVASTLARHLAALAASTSRSRDRSPLRLSSEGKCPSTKTVQVCIMRPLLCGAPMERRNKAWIVGSAHNGRIGDFRSRLFVARRGSTGWDVDFVPVTGLTDTERLMGLARTPEGLAAVAGSVHSGFLATFDRHLRQTGWYELAGVRDPHSVVAHGDRLWVVSSGTNQVIRFTMSALGPGDAEVVFSRGPGSHHFNGLTRHRGTLVMSAFGTSPQNARTTSSTGYLVDIDRGDRIREGLDQPHTPYSSNGVLLYCESRPSLVRSGDRVLAQLDGYLRGLAVGPDGSMYVAESAPRPPGGTTAEDRADAAIWTLSPGGQVVDHQPLAGVGVEIYDLALDPRRD